jgi:protein gp37
VTTRIEWTDETWNPTIGCTKVSAGCKNCYAERLWPKVEGSRVKREDGEPRPFTNVRCHPERLDAPLHWRKPRRVFVNSMSDLFHEDVPDEFIDKIFAVMALAPQHIFQALTKRPERMLRYCQTDDSSNHEYDPDLGGEATRDAFIEGQAQAIYEKRHGEDPSMCLAVHQPLKNVWLGVSVEDQATADERIPLLLQTPAAVRFVSYEPALSPVDFWTYLTESEGCANCGDDSFPLGHCCDDPAIVTTPALDWIIAGSESGPRARPAELDWYRSLRDQCSAAGVPFFLKQHVINGKKISLPELDGRTWAEYPTMPN